MIGSLFFVMFDLCMFVFRQIASIETESVHSTFLP